MGLTIGVRFIEGGKSKKMVIISEIRGRNAYPSGTTKFGTNRRPRRGWCHRIQDRQVICRGQNWRWAVWRRSWCQRILHKFRIEKEEKISKNGRLWRRGRKKLLKTRERTMFPKLNMTGDTKVMRNSNETPFEIHQNQGNNKDEYEARALFVYKEEEWQSKHNKKTRRKE